MSAKQRHRGVGVPVHEPRDDRHLLGVEHLVPFARANPRPDLLDRALPNADPRPLAVEDRVGYEEAHEPTSVSSGTMAPIAAASRSRFRLRPSSNSSTVSSRSPTPLARLSTMQIAAYGNPSSPAMTHS